MALIGNRSVLHKSPGRFLNGDAAILRSAFNKHGMIRNAAFTDLAIPRGHASPSAWVLPKIKGSISSFNSAKATLSGSGSGAMGVPIDGATSFVISIADADGQLISSGAGSTSFTISATGNVLATLSTTGTAGFTLSTNAPLLGAKGWIVGDAQFTVSGSLHSYAIGLMNGSTVDSSVLTVGAIAAGILAMAETNPIKSDIAKVNAVSVVGNGRSGSEWGPG